MTHAAYVQGQPNSTNSTGRLRPNSVARGVKFIHITTASQKTDPKRVCEVNRGKPW